MKSLLRRGVGVYFVLSALAKVYDVRASIAVVEAGYPGLPWPGLMVGGAIAVEVVLAGGLLLSDERGWVTGAALTLMLFTAFGAWALWHGAGSCGCLGALVQIPPAATIVKNVFLLGLLALSIRRSPVPA